MPPWGADGYFENPNGTRDRMVNRDVWVMVNWGDGPSAQKRACGNDEAALALVMCCSPAPEHEHRTDPMCDVLAVNGVMQGKRAAAHSVTGHIIHCGWVYHTCKRLRWLHETCSDIPSWWGEMAASADAACDVCLRACAPRQGPSGEFPKELGLIVFDVWICSIPFVHRVTVSSVCLHTPCRGAPRATKGLHRDHKGARRTVVGPTPETPFGAVLAEDSGHLRYPFYICPGCPVYMRSAPSRNGAEQIVILVAKL